MSIFFEERLIFKSISMHIPSKLTKRGATSITCIAFAITCWFFRSSLSFWEAVELVGAVIVAVGVVGEYVHEYRDWPKDADRKKRFGEWSLILLIVGLIIELLGMTRSMRLSNLEITSLQLQTAQSFDDAADAKLATAKLKVKVEELRQKNDALEAQAEPRFFRKESEAAKDLLPYAGSRAVIFVTAGDTESNTLAGEIFMTLESAHWSVTAELYPVIDPGIGVNAGPWPMGTKEMREAEKILTKDLNLSGALVDPSTMFDEGVTFKGLIIQVGRKPSPDEAEDISIQQRQWDTETDHPPSNDELQKLAERRFELWKKKGGGQVVPTSPQKHIIPAAQYPTQ